MSEAQQCDIAIVGGGLVGISLACALSHLDPAPQVVLIESHDYTRFPPAGFDARTLALSYSSQQIFAALGLWPAILSAGVSPIETIHISDRGHPGVTRLRAQEQGVESLGYVIENRVLGEALFAALQKYPNVRLLAPAEVVDLQIQSAHASLSLRQAGKVNTIDTRLVVAADGSDSFVRQHLHIKQQHWDYHQSAVIGNVACDQTHGAVAYERFTASGPMALLPLTPMADYPHRYGLVWTVPSQKVDEVMAMRDADFLQALQERFGQRAGTFIKAGTRHQYPLGLSMIDEHIRQRLAFIGNAAHTLHPVAGQGFNLGLRDVAALVEVIRDAMSQHKDYGERLVLQRYADWRRRDHRVTSLFTDSLVRVFSNNFFPLVVARNAGLLAMDLFAPIRKRLTRHAMGYVGKASLLARGLDL
jgi:2-octaprenyl-6-methoxyphenol hydroxylase